MNYVDERYESQLLNEFYNQEKDKQEILKKILKNKKKYQTERLLISKHNKNNREK